MHQVCWASGQDSGQQRARSTPQDSFCKDAGKYIQDAYPLAPAKKISSGMVNMLSQATIIKVENDDSGAAVAAVGKQLGGDVSWAEGLLE